MISNSFVSVNNSAAAIAHLLEKVEASVFVVAPRYAAVGSESIPLAQENGQETRFVPQASESVYDESARAKAMEDGRAWEYALAEEDEVELGSFIVRLPFLSASDPHTLTRFAIYTSQVHSSGSTGFPKPIMMTHRRALANYVINFDLKGFTTLP